MYFHMSGVAGVSPPPLPPLGGHVGSIPPIVGPIHCPQPPQGVLTQASVASETHIIQTSTIQQCDVEYDTCNNGSVPYTYTICIVTCIGPGTGGSTQHSRQYIWHAINLNTVLYKCVICWQKPQSYKAIICKYTYIHVYSTCMYLLIKQVST